MDAHFHIRRLSDRLLFIHWSQSPDSENEDAFLVELRWMLDESAGQQYVLSDLRFGRISSLRTLQQLAKLTEHARFAGSTAFSEAPRTKTLVGTFQAFAHKSGSRNEMHEKLEDALAFLESLEEGITAGIDWSALMDHPTSS
jgi:DNA-binding NarL/FixJ family response regulator